MNQIIEKINKEFIEKINKEFDEKFTYLKIQTMDFSHTVVLAKECREDIKSFYEQKIKEAILSVLPEEKEIGEGIHLKEILGHMIAHIEKCNEIKHDKVNLDYLYELINKL